MEAFLVSTGGVALAEMGDKVQILALILAAKYRRPWLLCLALLVASVASTALGGAIGLVLASVMKPDVSRWVLLVVLLGMAGWVLNPDAYEEGEERKAPLGVFGVAVLAFFLAEVAGKAQMTALVLTVQTKAVVEVVVGATLGMMIANVPAILIGDRFRERVRTEMLHWVAAAILAALAYLVFSGSWARFGF